MTTRSIWDSFRNMKTTRTREELIQTYRRLSAALADENLPESEARAIRAQLEGVLAEIEVAS